MRDNRPYEEGFLIILLVLALAGLIWLFSPFFGGALFRDDFGDRQLSFV